MSINHGDPNTWYGTTILAVRKPGRVVLIGDAGDPAEENVDTLSELDAWTRSAPDRTVTLFLGDNVYSVGFEPEDLSRGGAILGA